MKGKGGQDELHCYINLLCVSLFAETLNMLSC